MSKLDIVDMYTNIKTNEVLTIIEEQLIKNKKEPMRRLIITALNFLLHKTTYFTHDSIIYKQEKGLPMGGVLSSLLARIYVDTHIKRKLIPNEKTFINIYVDDILLLTHRNNIENAKATIKKALNLDLTTAMEENNTLTYLDLKLIKRDNLIKTAWHQKENTSDRMLNFLSHHTALQKKATVTQQLYTVTNLTDPEHITQAINRTIQKLKRNYYPIAYIRNIIHNMNQKERNAAKKAHIDALIHRIDECQPNPNNTTTPTHNNTTTQPNINPHDAHPPNTTTQGPPTKRPKLNADTHIIQHQHNKTLNRVIDNTFTRSGKRKNFILTNRLKKNAIFTMRKTKNQPGLERDAIIQNTCLNCDTVFLSATATNYLKDHITELVPDIMKHNTRHQHSTGPDLILKKRVSAK